MKYKIISVIMILFVLSVMNGCSSRSRNELSEQVSEITVSSDVSQKDERGYSAESSVPSDVSEEAESSYITENRVPSVVSERVEESIYVTDELFAEGFENKEFLVYKTHDNCYIEGEFVYAVNMADVKGLIDLTRKVHDKSATFYLFFSRNGFEENVKTVSQTIKNIMLIDLKGMIEE